MGNQLSVSGAAATIHLPDVSASLSMMAPLGGSRRGRLFTSMHCAVGNGEGSSGASNTGQQQRYEVVVKVFVRSAEDKLQAQLISQHHETLLLMERRLRQPGTAAAAAGSNEHNAVAVGVAPSSPEPSAAAAASHLLFYSELDRRDARYCKLQRPYVHFSLSERLQMRPICTDEQRLFFAYQLFAAVAQMHDAYKVVHGDLKIENCLVTSHHWLYVVDFSPFKPSQLPSYNPANFEFYYDVAETRVCCAAPEKFFDGAPSSTSSTVAAAAAPVVAATPPTIDASGTPSAEAVNTSAGINLNGSGKRPTTPLTPLPGGPSSKPSATTTIAGHSAAMDVFSCACVVAQLLTDEPLFRLSGVLELRSKQSFQDKAAFVTTLFNEIGLGGDDVRELLLSCICNGPDRRPSAQEAIELAFKSGVFPTYFAFIRAHVIAPLLRLPPDVQILVLHSRWEEIMQVVGHMAAHPDATVAAAVHTVRSGTLSDEDVFASAMSAARRGAVSLLLPVVTTSMRHLKTVEAACRALDILQKSVPSAHPSVVRDVITPYVVHSFRRFSGGAPGAAAASRGATQSRSDAVATAQHAHGSGGASAASHVATLSGAPLVRAKALDVIRRIADMAHTFVIPSESLLFDDYLLPVLSDAVKDHGSHVVLSCLAEHAPHVLLAALRFLEWRHVHFSGSAASQSFEKQLATLVSFGFELMKDLLKQRSTAVVIAALREVPTMCAFLGEERVQDEFLPLLTTLMACPAGVRRVLLPQAILVHASLGAPKLKTLQFFFEEGLRQTEDTACVASTISALTDVIRRLHGTGTDALRTEGRSGRKVDSARIPVVQMFNLVLQVVTHLANPNQAVQRAACALIETAASAYRACDVMLHLEGAVRPFLTHPVPMSMLSALPQIVKDEVSWVHQGATDVRSVPATTQQNNGSMAALSGANGAVIAIGSSCATHTSADLLCDAVHVDASEPGGTASNGSDAPEWRMCLNATQRQRCRWAFRKEWETTCASGLQMALRSRAAAVAEKAAAAGAGSSGQQQQAKALRSSSPRRRQVATATGQFAAMRPTASAIFSSCEHSSPIYCMDSTGGLLVTGGARGILKTWEISSDDYSPAHSVVSNNVKDVVPVTESVLSLTFLQPAPPPTMQQYQQRTERENHVTPASVNGALAVGGTSGVVRFVDVEHAAVLHQQHVAGGVHCNNAAPSPVTKLTRLLHHSLVLASTASGHLCVLDSRQPQGVVWSTVVPASYGPITSTLALGPADSFGAPTAMQHAVVASTMLGHVLLFDLRYRLTVSDVKLQSRMVPDANNPSFASTSVASSFSAPLVEISCMAHDVAGPPTTVSQSKAPSPLSPTSSMVSPTSILLGTRRHGILRYDLSTSAVTQSMTTNAPTEVRALLAAPRSNVVVAGTTDGLIRLWALGANGCSTTLATRAGESPKYTVVQGASSFTVVSSSTPASASTTTDDGPAGSSSGISSIVEGETPLFGFGPQRGDFVKGGARAYGGTAHQRQHHRDQVTALHVMTLRTSQLLVSGSRDGTVTVWHNVQD